MDDATVIDLVRNLPAGSEKRIALAVINSPASTYRIDRHGYPAWRWRGADDIGACVHIDPKTGAPFLETQYPLSLRTNIQKYIDLGTDGVEWMCRTHIQKGPFDYEYNWSTAECDREGRVLLKLLSRAL